MTTKVPVKEKDFGVLSNDPKIVERARLVCEEFQYTFEAWDDLDQFMESSQRTKLLLAHFTGPDGPMKASELGQLVRSFSGDSYLVCLTKSTLNKDDAQFTRKSGCDILLLEDELFKTGKLEFICTQVIRSQYIPIKTSDLVLNHALYFDLFHLMPLRGKFLRFAHDGDDFNSGRLAKAQAVGEFYIGRDSGPRFNQYIQETSDQSAAGLEKRCRSQFLNLFSEFSQLAFQLTNQSEHATFGDGQKLLAQCSQACKTLIETLGENGQPWRVINNSSIGEFGSLERAPAVAAYAGLFALQMGMEQIDQIMISALLTDLGLLFIGPGIMKKIRQSQNTFSSEEKREYENYPVLSLDIILSRKLSIPESQRSWIVSTRERFDGNGFPKKNLGEQVPIEARLIAFCREFDRRTLLKMGATRPDPTQLLREMIYESIESTTLYGEDLLTHFKSIVDQAVTLQEAAS